MGDVVDSGFLIAFGNYFNSASMKKVTGEKLDQDILFCSMAVKGAIKDVGALVQELEDTLDDLNEKTIVHFNQASSMNWLETPDTRHYFKYIIKGLINDLYYWGAQ